MSSAISNSSRNTIFTEAVRAGVVSTGDEFALKLFSLVADAVLF